MSTNCHIGLMHEDNTIDAIYCHWDGYPSYVGRILYKYYNNPEDITKLLSLGDISTLREDVKDTYNYDDDKGPTNYKTINKFIHACRLDYTYLYMKGKWFYRRRGDSLMMLTEESIKLDQ